MHDWPRVILHVDMDAFFASVEQRDDPALRGKPVLVGYDGPRGVVAAASYEARVYGCRSAMPMAVARRLCPHAVVVSGGFHKYRAVSRQVFAILNDFSPAIEPVSVDEAFVDLTGTRRLLGAPIDIARAIRKRIRNGLHLTASAGLAPNKFLAKLASDLDKPDGLTVIGPDDIDRVLPPLPVTRLWGVGPKTAERLQSLGVRTVGDVRRLGREWLVTHLGADAGEHFHRLAHGLDDRAVVTEEQSKQIGHETTFGQDLVHPDEVRAVLLELTEQVAARLRQDGRRAGTVTLKIRYGDFETITRAQSLPEPTDVTVNLWNAARDLFDHWAAAHFRPVRLIGVSVSHLAGESAQLPLFEHPADQKQRRLDAAVDAIQARFGRAAVWRAGRMRKDES